MKMATKKFINSVERCVDESLEGHVFVNPGARLLKGHRVVVRGDADAARKAGKVAVLCGGGSGHEPAHAGYVGKGMLSGAIAGSIFASPPPSAVLAAIHAVGGSAGTLLVIKNYTGDRINFGIANKRAENEGYKVDMVVVGEDCALTTRDKTAGRRGLCGVLLVQKIAGALAEEGRSLEEIVKLCNEAINEMGTMGVTLAPCTLPGSDGPSFQLGPDEMELGLGLHGEAGVKRTKVMSAKEVVAAMISHMTNTESPSHVRVQKGDHVALFINNLGGASYLELNIIAREAICYFESMGVFVDRCYSGPLITSMEMAGVSITVMQLNDVRKRCLDAPTDAPAWPRPYLPVSSSDRLSLGPLDIPPVADLKATSDNAASVDKATSCLIFKALHSACTALINNEKLLNQLDRECGDGDCGSTLKAGATAIQMELGSEDKPTLPVLQPFNLLISLANIVENVMGGTSGGIYSLFLTAAANPLHDSTSPIYWLHALQAGTSAIQRYGGAEPGDRTVLDALCPVQDTLSKSLPSSTPLDSLLLAVEAAEKGAQSTAGMQGRAGRASYVDVQRSSEPDAGATAVAIWLRAVYEALKSA